VHRAAAHREFNRPDFVHPEARLRDAHETEDRGDNQNGGESDQKPAGYSWGLDRHKMISVDLFSGQGKRSAASTRLNIFGRKKFVLVFEFFCWFARGRLAIYARCKVGTSKTALPAGRDRLVLAFRCSRKFTFGKSRLSTAISRFGAMKPPEHCASRQGGIT
jgi:hypothetical protein